MNGCLSDKLLVRCYFDDCADDERTHLQSCLPCRRRYQRLAAEMDLIGKALRESWPIRPSDGAWRLLPWGMTAMALGFAAALLYLLSAHYTLERQNITVAHRAARDADTP